MEFLSLVAAARRLSAGPVFGLDSAIVDQLARLTAAQLEVMAEVPCLLAGFAAPYHNRGLVRVAEPRPADDAGWTEHARLFAAGLLTYAWQMGRRDALLAALCAGPAACADGATARDIRGHADRALQQLEARFRNHARFWPDLVRATRDGRQERLQLARLTAIQLATLEARRRPTARLVAGSAGTR